MALRIYVDECVSGVLVSGLRHRGVDIVTSAEEGLLGADDSQHFARAIALDRALLTADEDFLPLAIGLLRRGGVFPGLIYILPRTVCPWSGLGSTPGREIFTNGDLRTTVIAHEFGHNLGFGHASSVSCTLNGSPVTFAGTCSYPEYGDPFSVMGAGGQHYNATHKAAAGFIPPARRLTALGPGRYTIASSSVPGTQPQLLVIPYGEGNRTLQLELRSTVPGSPFESFAVTSPAVTGVTVRLAATAFGGNTRLLDAVPSTSTMTDAPFLPGKSFSDSSFGLRFDVVSVSGGTATIDVTSPRDTSAPTSPGPLAVDNVRPGVIGLRWLPATDNWGIASYRIFRNDELVASVADDVSAYEDEVAVGPAYVYKVQAVDTSENVGPSTPLVRIESDVYAPSAPARLRAIIMPGPVLRLNWDPSTDDGKVEWYEVLRNGREIGDAVATTFVDRHAPAGGAPRYEVRAVDGAGRPSPTAALLVRVPVRKSLRLVATAGPNVVRSAVSVRLTATPRARLTYHLAVGRRVAGEPRTALVPRSGVIGIRVAARATTLRRRHLKLVVTLSSPGSRAVVVRLAVRR